MATMTNKVRIAAVSAFAAMGFFVAGAAHAAGVDAGTTVSNTFTLDYEVSSTAQPQITNDGVGGNAPPTIFTVDRVVDVLVSSEGDVNVTPGTTDELIYGVLNEGNDNQAYSLTLEDLAGDDFDVAPVTIRYYADNGDGIYVQADDMIGPGTAYTIGAATVDIVPDATIWVFVSGAIPGAVTNGQTDGIILQADSLNPVTSLDPAYSATAGVATIAEAGANNLTGEAQNVLADPGGPASGDGAGDGAHSATASFIVAAADLTATKVVAVIATDSSAPFDCAVDPAPAGNQYAVPGACVEYLIQVANAGTAAATATNINIGDVLPDEVQFVGAVHAGFTTLGVRTDPPGGCTTACSVSVTGATLDPGDTGTLTIRAVVR